MMRENVSLKPYNTFGLEAHARYFQEIPTLDALLKVLRDEKFRDMPRLILGGGSNVLLTGDYEGLVLYNALQGISLLEENDEDVLIECASGEVWHELVMHAVGRGWAGIENLSLIPGTVGAAPMQNIGAYGVEIKEVLESVRFLHLDTLETETYLAAQCEFGYRESVFKHRLKGKVFILSVRLRLKKANYTLRLEYGAIQDTLKEMGIENPGIREVSDAVIHIRRSKLPDPKELGNAGSFFKNPEISESQYRQLLIGYPEMPAYPTSGGWVKVPAGWLIEKAGWKGKRVGQTGSHARQALVLVNFGGATGAEIRDLAFQIIADIETKFGIRLLPEVNFI